MAIWDRRNPGVVVGSFGAANLLANGMVFLAGPIASGFCAALARTRDRRTAATGLGSIFAVCVVSTGGLTLFEQAILTVLLGNQFHTSHFKLFAFALSATATACCTYILWMVRARQSSFRGIGIVTLVAIAVELVIGVWVGQPGVVKVASLPLLVLGSGTAVNLVANLGRVLRPARQVNEPVPVE